MQDHKPRPAWLVPAQYNEEPPITPNVATDPDDDPIDYSRGPDRSQVFGDDGDDVPESAGEEIDP